tara:strand:+ start:663 stop:896 length:234 start_codon:yes stop_codon:yes gene_type:complete
MKNQEIKKKNAFEQFLYEVKFGPMANGYKDLRYVSETQQDYLFGKQWYRFSYNEDAMKGRSHYVSKVSFEKLLKINA